MQKRAGDVLVQELFLESLVCKSVREQAAERRPDEEDTETFEGARSARAIHDAKAPDPEALV